MKFNSIGSKLAIVAASLFFGFAAVGAQATTIDLSGAAEGGAFTNPNNAVNGPSLYTAQGFQFAAINPVGDSDGAHFHVDYFGAGTVILHDNTSATPDIWKLSRVDNGSFNAASFTEIGTGLLWSTNLQSSWTASVAGLNVINQIGVTSLSFKLTNPGACCSTGMDRFEVTAVPEPETYAMMLAGLGLMGSIARRRKAKKTA